MRLAAPPDDPTLLLPGPLPPGERLLWHGRPSARALSRRLFRVRAVAVYFAVLACWPVAASLAAGAPPAAAAMGLLVPLPLALPVLGLLWAASHLVARTSDYFVTDRRVILQTGVAIAGTVNVPLGRIQRAEVREHADGSRDIALVLRRPGRLAYLALWPHARPWALSEPQPMLRDLACAAPVEEILTAALMQAAPGVRHAPPAGAAEPARGAASQPAPAAAAAAAHA